MITNSTSAVAKWTIIAAGAVSSVYAGVNYWKASQEPQLIKHPADFCTRCHTDEKTIKAMNEKAGYEVAHVPLK